MRVCKKVLFLLVISLQTFAENFSQCEPLTLDLIENGPLVASVISFEDVRGNGRSYKNGYESVEAFFALYSHCTCFPFIDVNVLHIGQKDQYAANLGFGCRALSFDFCEMIGANIYYDFRHIPQGYFQQIGLGVELFGRNWDTHINGYIPFGKNKAFIDRTLFNYAGGDFFAIGDRYKTGLWGLDIEVGRQLCQTGRFNWYGAIGPYFYQSSCSCSAIFGGMGRIRATFCKYFSIECFATYDQTFGSRLQGRLTLSIPIPLPCNCECERYFLQPIQRNKIIILDDICFWDTNF